MAEKIVIASGKGGVGKSTCAAGIGIALKEKGKKVLLVDFDIGLSSLDLILNVGEKVVNHWGDVILENCEKDRALIDVDGLYLLPAPKSGEKEYTVQNIKAVIKSYDEDFDYILIDSPAGIGKYFSASCICADRGIVVSNSEDICVRSASIAANRMRENGVEDVRLIINKLNKKFSIKKKNLNIDNVIDGTSVRLIGAVPLDKDISLLSMEKNMFRLKSKPQHAFVRIASRICGEDIDLKI